MSVFDVQWDAIVIGTGIGGGTIGRALTEAGQKVLFVEQGPAGFRSEENGLSEIFVPEARLIRGLWPDPLHVTVDGRSEQLYAPLGAGVGGSSAFYAATLERPERHDLDPVDGKPHPTGGWPVSFDAMTPYYAKAAAQYRVYGSPDPLGESRIPLRAPPDLSATESALMDSLTHVGLHPYHAHTGLERLPGCATCLGHKCPRACKMDGRSAGVEPALATGNATLLDRARVRRLGTNGDTISHVELIHDGMPRRLTARRYILAGGALGSPHLLLKSANEAWPSGVANRSGLVGRNLMFHVNELFALWPQRGTPDSGATKAISLRDLYHPGQRFGTIQAMGIRASYGEIVHYLNLMLARSPLARMRGLSQLTRIPAALAHRAFGSAQIFVGLLEDLPYAENRVTWDAAAPDRLSVDYTLHDELKSRHRAFRRAIRRAFKGHRRMMLGHGIELNWGHPSGTLRYGTDRTQSVLRPDCRTHDIGNLWVVDASFMPTSMGVNPSLTIAANALRVAETITKGAT